MELNRIPIQIDTWKVIEMKKNLMQLGRSMVEMLGVLAIIGVLSIVGIAGYKKAMAKIHANELME